MLEASNEQLKVNLATIKAVHGTSPLSHIAVNFVMLLKLKKVCVYSVIVLK